MNRPGFTRYRYPILHPRFSLFKLPVAGFRGITRGMTWYKRLLNLVERYNALLRRS